MKRKRALKPAVSKAQWITILQTQLLNLRDQQLTVGIAMIIAGAALHCTISVYHFTIIVDLLWFTANVHLLSIMSLKRRLRQMPVGRNWRILLMLFMALSLATFQVFTAHDEWDTSWPYQFQCLSDTLSGHINGEGLMWMMINLVLISILYGVALIQVFESWETFTRKWLFEVPRSIFVGLRQRSTQGTGLLRLWHVISWVAISGGLAPVMFLAIVIDSECCRLLMSCIWFAYGIWGFKQDRSVNPDFFEEAEEGIFGFGQITPIILLCMVFFYFGQAYYGEDSQMAFKIE